MGNHVRMQDQSHEVQRVKYAPVFPPGREGVRLPPNSPNVDGSGVDEYLVVIPKSGAGPADVTSDLDQEPVSVTVFQSPRDEPGFVRAIGGEATCVPARNPVTDNELVSTESPISREIPERGLLKWNVGLESIPSLDPRNAEPFVPKWLQFPGSSLPPPPHTPSVAADCQAQGRLVESRYVSAIAQDRVRNVKTNDRRRRRIHAD